MIITNSDVVLQAQHQLRRESGKSESLTIWSNIPPATQQPPPADSDSVTIASTDATTRSGATIIDDAPPTADEDLELRILRRLVEMLTGKKIDITTGQKIAAKAQQAQQIEEGDSVGMVYTYQEYQHESEQVSFSATAQINTADGRSIDVQIELNMSREFYQETSLEMRSGAALTDPLVFNFNGNAAELSDDTFSFDLDLDGKNDQMAFMTPDSAFLALDRNGDGTINNGSELFGPTSGDGFTELAAFDSDGNNWIDENDGVFDNLRIFGRDTNGQRQLLTLGQAGIGAIYLGRVASPFSITNSDNNQLGQVRSSGLFLFEDGRAGTVQQVDFVV